MYQKVKIWIGLEMINGVECNFYRMRFEIKHFKMEM